MYKSFVALTTAAVIAIGGTAYAVEKADTAKTPQTSAEDGFLDLSKDGITAMRDIRAARIAIFNGETDEALVKIKEAQSAADAAAKQSVKLDKFAGEGPTDLKKGQDYVPICSAVSVTETENLSAQHVGRLTKANMALRTGDNAAAAAALKAVPGEIQYSFASVPLDRLVGDVENAKAQLDKGQFQEANLTLKGIEDSVDIHRFTMDGLSGNMKVSDISMAQPAQNDSTPAVDENS